MMIKIKSNSVNARIILYAYNLTVCYKKGIIGYKKLEIQQQSINNTTTIQYGNMYTFYFTAHSLFRVALLSVICQQ